MWLATNSSGCHPQMLNLCTETYWSCLRETEFGAGVSSPANQTAHQGGLHEVFCLAIQTAEQIVEAIVVEHYMSILLFKPKNWVLCHQPATLEEAIVLMEAYTSAKAGDLWPPSHFQCECPHMNCSIMKLLRGTQVAPRWPFYHPCSF